MMNRILFESHEAEGDRLILRDARAQHILKVLKALPGDVLKLGEINGPRVDGHVWACGEGQVELKLHPGEIPLPPALDLLLALPRPKVLHRLLPQIAALGVGRIFLCNAARVERYYFDTHVLDDTALREALLDGLTQCGDTLLPEVRILRRLQPFVQDELDGLSAGMDRWLLHPGHAPHLSTATPQHPRALLAIGPEGGWVPHELDLFKTCGFETVSIGDRILRSDTATLAALALADSRFPKLGTSIPPPFRSSENLPTRNPQLP